eukprot:5843360-Pyramimonas_sp.AAC.1
MNCIAQHASTWGRDKTAWLLSCDIERAFDAVTLPTVSRAMTALGISARLQCALLEPLSSTSCTVLFEGVTIPNVQWDRSLRTGGTDSPIAFTIVTISMWRDVIARLDQRGVGIEMPCHDNHC